MRSRLLVGLALAAALAVAATAAASRSAGAAGCRAVRKPAAHAAPKLKPPTARLPRGKRWTAVVTTNCGSFTVLLDARRDPKTAASFASLARHGYFDRTIFHRIVPGFVIQGGDPTQSGLGGPGYTVVEPPPRATRYTRGVVAMAKAGNDPSGASGSQFFVVTAPDARLPPIYAVVGRVTNGLRVVEAIGRLGDANEQPTRTIEILRVRIASR